MNNKQLTRRISEQTGLSRAEAADGLESVVTRILEKLRKGKRAPLGKLGARQHDVGRLHIAMRHPQRDAHGQAHQQSA